MSEPNDPDDEDDRKLANAMVDARNADNCLSSGRRNCIPLDVPARQQ